MSDDTDLATVQLLTAIRNENKAMTAAVEKLSASMLKPAIGYSYVEPAGAKTEELLDKFKQGFANKTTEEELTGEMRFEPVASANERVRKSGLRLPKVTLNYDEPFGIETKGTKDDLTGGEWVEDMPLINIPEEQPVERPEQNLIKLEPLTYRAPEGEIVAVFDGCVLLEPHMYTIDRDKAELRFNVETYSTPRVFKREPKE